MKTIIEDNRNEAQRKTHYLAVVARDKFLSCLIKGGNSRCAWSLDPTEVNSDRVFNWVKSRKDMRNANIVDLRTYRPPANTAHFHIYVCDKDHVAAKY